MSFEEEGQKLAQLAFGDMIRELFHEDTSLLSIVNPAAKTLDEDELNNSEQMSLDKIFSSIGEKIEVPSAARKRILEICDERGVPDTEDLALEVLSQVLSTNKLSQDKNTSAREQLVKAFVSLIVFALAYLLPKKSDAMVLRPNLPRIGVNQTGGAKVDVDETGGTPYKGLSKLASLSSVQFNRTQRQTNRVLRQPTVALAKKKVLNSQNPTLLSESDKKKFGDIYVKQTFDFTRKELTIEGSSPFRAISTRPSRDNC